MIRTFLVHNIKKTVVIIRDHFNYLSIKDFGMKPLIVGKKTILILDNCKNDEWLFKIYWI